MKVNQFIVAGLLALILGITSSCALMQDLFDDKVLTTRDNVVAEDRATAIPADLGLIPPDVRKKFEDAGKEIVLVDKGSVVNPEEAVDIEDPDAGDLISVGLGIANSVIPGVAALEGLGLLFSQRKRKHYKDACAKALPFNGKVEVKDAVLALGRAIGIAHSSEKSKEAFEGETVKKAT